MTNPNSSISTTQTVVEGIGVPQTIVSVTGVSPASASQGTSNLLLTITGTGFSTPVSDSTVTFPAGSQITVVPGTTTFVSPTTITVSVNIALGAPAPASYPISVTNQGQPKVTSKTNLFTVLALKVAGMHVGSVATNIADPAKSDPDEPTGGWDAWLTVTVVSGSGAPLQGAVINGSWNLAGFNDITSCTTDTTGSCTVYMGYADQLPHNQSPLPTFTLSTSTSTNPTVGGIVLNGYTYDGSGGTWTVPVPT